MIDRFSEDIDLSLAPAFLGISEPDLTTSLSKTQGTKWMKKAETACIQVVRDSLAPELEQTIVASLGPRPEPWLGFAVDAGTGSPVVSFRYPTSQPVGFDYLKRAVKLEFGSLSDQRPIERQPVRPWIADVLPEAFGDWQCSVVALDAQRTFWEKATILHSEHHRPADSPMPDRFSRHYADTAALARHPAVAAAISRDDLRGRVVAWKSRFFGSAWARYDLARAPTFKLVPSGEREKALRDDYKAMRDMYLGEPLPFDDVMATLLETEAQVNSVF
ncbi:MAG: nucleotidyl transferase AbiEii/AbiGii toxin family protein [Vicinamibacterales bacterium]